MTLERYEYESTGVVQSRLVACPFCAYEFADYEPRWKHFYTEHTPADAGLSSLAGESVAAPRRVAVE